MPLKATYEVIGLIHEGGMGAVYEVRHLQLDELRALKVLKPHIAGDPEFQARFLREAQVASRMRHAGIAQVFDFAQDAATGFGFLIMELLPGGTLKAFCDLFEVVPIDLILELSLKALQPLAFLHSRGYIHRDVSPDNIMVLADDAGSPIVKLIDLGVIKGKTDIQLTVGGAFLGKFLFAAPELYHSGDERDLVGIPSDLYSFGVILYLMLTGQFPFSGSDANALIGAHLYRPPLPFEASDPHGRVPGDLRAIALRLLAKNPQDRFRSAEETIAALAAVQRRFPPFPRDLRPFIVRIQRPAQPIDDDPRDQQVREAVARTFGSQATGSVFVPTEAGSPAQFPLSPLHPDKSKAHSHFDATATTLLIPALRDEQLPQERAPREQPASPGLSNRPPLAPPPTLPPPLPRPQLAAPILTPSPPEDVSSLRRLRDDITRDINQCSRFLFRWSEDLWLNARQAIADAEWPLRLKAWVTLHRRLLLRIVVLFSTALVLCYFGLREKAPEVATLPPTEEHSERSSTQGETQSATDDPSHDGDGEFVAPTSTEESPSAPEESPAPDKDAEDEVLAALLRQSRSEGRLSAVLSAAAAVEEYERKYPASVAKTDPWRATVRQIARRNRALEAAILGKKWMTVIDTSIDLRKEFPRELSLIQAQDQAATEIENEANSLSENSQLVNALALLGDLFEKLPERPRLAELIKSLENQQKWLDLEKDARAMAEGGRPQEALALLGAAGQPEIRKSLAIHQLENEILGIWVRLDQGTPKVSVVQFDYPRDQDARLELAISDDLEVTSAVAWVRPKASAIGKILRDIRYSRLDLAAVGSERWRLSIPVKIHGNASAVELYIEATDHHGHRGRLGSSDAPKIFHRED